MGGGVLGLFVAVSVLTKSHESVFVTLTFGPLFCAFGSYFFGGIPAILAGAIIALVFPALAKWKGGITLSALLLAWVITLSYITFATRNAFGAYDWPWHSLLALLSAPGALSLCNRLHRKFGPPECDI